MKKFEKVLAVVMAGAMLTVSTPITQSSMFKDTNVSTTVNAQSIPTLALSDVKAKAGEKVKIAMEIKDNSDFLFRQLGAVINTDLVLDTCDKGVIFNKDGVRINITTLDAIPYVDNKEIVVVASPRIATEGNGNIAYLFFTVPEDAKVGTVYNIDWGNINDFSDGTNNISDKVGLKSGSVTVLGDTEVDTTIYGDVDDDGKVTAVDAALILKHFTVGLKGKSNIITSAKALKAADVNYNGKIDATDAAYTLKYFVLNINGSVSWKDILK